MSTYTATPVARWAPPVRHIPRIGASGAEPMSACMHDKKSPPTTVPLAQPTYSFGVRLHRHAAHRPHAAHALPTHARRAYTECKDYGLRVAKGQQSVNATAPPASLAEEDLVPAAHAEARQAQPPLPAAGRSPMDQPVPPRPTAAEPGLRSDPL